MSSSDEKHLPGLKIICLGENIGPVPYLPLTRCATDAGSPGGALSQLYILKELMARLALKSETDRPPLPCDYFDLIGGAGLGGYVLYLTHYDYF